MKRCILIVSLFLAGCAAPLVSMEGGIVGSPGGFEAYCDAHPVAQECSKP